MSNHTAAIEPFFAANVPSMNGHEDKHDDHARVVKSEALLQGSRTVHITHNGCTYRLQATRLGKLILTK